MICVILESPYAGDERPVNPKTVEKNVAYARECMLDCLNRGESPMVSHLLYTQVLADNDPIERQLGIDAGLAWRKVAQKSVVYIDNGVSGGMWYGVDLARDQGIPVEFRTLKK